MMRNMMKWFNTKNTKQSEPLENATTPQVENSAGGYVWDVDDWVRLDRFLVLGSDGGSYYASERTLTVDNARAVLRCVQADGQRAVQRIVDISKSGRAPKNAAAIFALAMAMKLGDDETRQHARAAVPQVCRIGTHLFAFAEAVNGFGGWGRGTQRAFGSWYADKDPRALAYQAVKYQRRQGWAHRDLLRKAHVKPPTAEHDAVFRWMVKGWDRALDAQAPADAMGLIWAFERAKVAENVAEIVRLIQDFGLTREAVPTNFLNDPQVWDALLDNRGRGMPMTAMIRNLGKMTDVGLLATMSEASRFVVGRLGNREALRKARVHPLAALVALNTYQSGRGVRGSLKWTPVQPVVDALDQAFYATFDTLDPTGLRWMLGVDVSGSMGWGRIAGLPGLTPRVAAAAMAMVTARVESQHAIMAFTGTFVPLNISPRERLDAVVRKTDNLAFGATDCALPMQYALKHRIPVDVFTIYTDCETWFGKVHPVQALAKYRRTMGIPAKLIVVGFVANKFTIADPDDAGMLDVVGFDTAAPAVMRDFAMS